MNQMKESPQFTAWRDALADDLAVAAIHRRIWRAGRGNFGDHHSLAGTDGLWEMRIDHGPGYRLYYARDGATVYVLLAGGDKASQRRDIARAEEILKTWREKPHDD